MADDQVTPPAPEVRPFEELSESGLLWLINRAVFHPRGFALALTRQGGLVIGWKLLGDGSEPWQFTGDEDAHFAHAEKTLRRASEAWHELEGQPSKQPEARHG